MCVLSINFCYQSSLFKEGIEIRLTNKKLRINRDKGRDLSPEWFSIVKKIQHRRLHQSFDYHHSAAS